MLFELFRTLIAWLVILPSAFLAGTFYERLVPQRDPLIRGILYYALGLATLSYGVVALSAMHLLATPYIWAMLFLPVIIRVPKFGEWLQWQKELTRSLLPGRDLFPRILFGLFAVSFICLLMGTLTPELGGDALCYQLNLPKVFLRQGSLTPDPLDYNSFFPLFINNLFLIGLATGGAFAAKMFHFFCGFLLFLLVKRLLQSETKNYLLSLFVALVVLATPTVYNLLSTAYIDVALALYTLLAVETFVRALSEGGKKDFFLGGLLIGCGVATKYLCLISMVALFCVWLYSLITTRRLRFHLSGSICFTSGILIVAGYWFVRNGLMTGNPFFPYWGRFFGVESRPTPDFSIFGYGTSLFHYLSLYFNMFLSPANFGTFSGRIGIFYFLFIPFILVGMLFVPRSRPYGIFWLSFTAVIFFIAQADRWILPVLPVMALSAGFGIHWLYGYGSPAFKKLLKYMGGGLAIMVLCVYVATGIYHYRYAYLLFSGQWSVEKYLTSLERTSTVARWINQHLPADAKILVDSETRNFYFDRPVVRQVFLEWQTRKTENLSDPKVFWGILRRHEVTHALVRHPAGNGQDFSEISPAVRGFLSSRFAREIYSGDSQNIRENRYRYRIFERLAQD